jgi:NTP pyrophosphatase (non-canonical NTP hydrolase)
MAQSDDMTIRGLTMAFQDLIAKAGWYDASSTKQQKPRNLAISLSLEAAEVLEHFQWDETFDAEALGAELADVALYLVQLAHVCGIDLQQAIEDKLAVNYDRFCSKA